METNQPTYSQEIYGSQPNPSQQQVYQLPSNFLETEDHSAVNVQDSMLQQRIISGEYAPEPAEYCNVGNEPVYAQYDPFQTSFANQQPAPQFYQQNPDSFAPQYGQIEDPWMGQQDANVYAQEEYDPTYNEQQYPYAAEQSTSSNQLNNNPFEEEEPYEPTSINVQPMRRIGQPPAASMTRGPVTRTYKLVYARPQTIRQPQNGLPTETMSRPPRKQIIRRDSDEDTSFLNKDGTEKARSQAAQRLRTPEGWVQFNQWLKKAQEEKDRKKTISLLELCLEADIPAELITKKDIDTPKVVKAISRKDPNATINKLSNDLINMWKKTITANAKSSTKKSAEKPTAKSTTEEASNKSKDTSRQESAGDSSTAPQYTIKENLLDELTEAMSKRDDPSVLPPADDSKRPRTKAKVKLSKSRLTGLEDEEENSVKVVKKDKPIKKKPVENVPVVSKPASTPTPKRQLQESDVFMAAFDDAPKKAPPAKKLKINKVVKVVQPDVPEGEATSPVIKSEFDIKPESSVVAAKPKETLDQIPAIPRNRGGGILRSQALTAEEKNIRKIRFNDQFGKDLVHIRHFDIEEGERINVCRTYDQIKRWEIEDEGKHFRHKGVEADEPTVDDSSIFTNSSSVKLEPSSLSPTLPQVGRKTQMPPLPFSGVPSSGGMDDSVWNLIPLENFETFNRGTNSVLGQIEAEREKNAMVVFIDQNNATDVIGEDDPELHAVADAASQDQIIRIPLILQHSEQQRQAEHTVDDMDIDVPKTRQNTTVLPPLPFSSATSTLSQTAGTFADPHLEFQKSVLDSLPAVSPPLITTSTTSVLNAPVQNVDNFMELLKQQADKDLRPSEANDEQMDQDLRSPADTSQPDKMEYDPLDTPLSPPPEQNVSVPAATVPTSTSSGITIDVLSTLASLAGKDSNSVTAGLSLVGGIDLASILSKVESAQSGSSKDSSQYHKYAQEDSNVAPTVITQIHDTYFQQGNYSSNQFSSKPGSSIRYPSPGVRPTSTNPRAGYFQTPTNMSRFRTVPCKYFLAGTCNFGEACRFLHATPDGQIIPHKSVAQNFAHQYEQEEIESVEPQQQPEESSPSFQLALAPKTSTYSMEAAANFMQRGGPRGRGRGFRGGFRRGGYEERPSRSRDRRSPRRYDERRRYSPTRRRRRSRSESPAEGGRRHRRSSSNSSNEDTRKRRERSKSPIYDDKSPPRNERKSPDQEREAEDQE